MRLRDLSTQMRCRRQRQRQGLRPWLAKPGPYVTVWFMGRRYVCAAWDAAQIQLPLQKQFARCLTQVMRPDVLRRPFSSLSGARCARTPSFS